MNGGIVMNKKKLLWAGLGATLFIILGIYWYMGSGTVVETVKADIGDVELVLEETGYTESVSDYTIDSPKTARVLAVNVRVGQEVGADSDLIVLQNLEADNLIIPVKSEITGIRTQILSIQEQLNPVNVQIASSLSELTAEKNTIDGLKVQVQQAQESYDRTAQLYEAGAVSKADFDTAGYNVKLLENQLKTHEDNIAGLESTVSSLDQQKSQIESDVGTMNEELGLREADLNDLSSDLIVTSLNGGRILELPAKVGQVVAPGTPLAKIGGPTMLQIRADILSDDMAGVKEGQKVAITAPVLSGKVISGAIRQIYPSAFEKTSALGVIQRRVSIIIGIEETANLKPGYEVTVGIETDKKSGVLRLPRASVRSTADGGYETMRIVDGKIVISPVKIGLKNQDWVEIVSGIQKGDIIVKDASQSLDTGTRVNSKS